MLFSTSRFFKLSLLMLTVGVALFLSRKYGGASNLKSIEDYWTESGLGPVVLEDLLQDQTCVSSEKYFLACTNSILTVANRFNLTLNTEGKLVNAILSADMSSEKRQLEPWKEFFLQHTDKAAHLSFLNAWTDLKSHYISSEQLSMMTGLGLNGFISVFRDPHTYFMPVAQFKEVISKTDSHSTSLGLFLAINKGRYIVRKILNGSAAETVGIKRADILVAINGQKTDGLLQARISELLKGKENETINLVIRRDGQELSYKLQHKELVIPTVSIQVVDGIKPFAIIGINKFSKGTCEKVKESLGIVKRASVRGLLLDLRDNPGGQMEEAACVASLFVGPNKKIFEVRYLDPSKKSEEYFGEENKIFDFPVAVLINGYSASAAEIVAGALRDLNRAVLVGEKTFGKGSFQEGEYWSQNKKIALFETKGFYYLPSGESPQMKGLEPDVTVKFDNIEVARESDQFMSALKAPINQTHVTQKLFLFNKCLQIEESEKLDDIQLSKAREILFCSNAVAKAGL
ncbi:MAG: S41 family peptidase [Pseudobdellovibrionaceae bacterium]